MPPKRDVYRLYAINDLIALGSKSDTWIIEDMIPKAGRVLAYGSGGSLKTSIIFDLAIAVASGGKLLERMAVIKHWGPAIVLSTEGSLYTNADRILAYTRSRNVSTEAVQLYYGRQGLDLTNDADTDTFAKIIESVRPVMVVVDPLVSFYGGDENSTSDMSRFVRNLDWIIDEYQTTIIVIHHANKMGDMRGNTVLQGWADSVLQFTAKKEVELDDVGQNQTVLTVRGQKQRDGQEGVLFSAVPFFDKELGMTTFAVYTGENSRMVAVTHLKNKILKYLRQTGAVLSKSQLADVMKSSTVKTNEALDWLAMIGLVEPVEVRRSTGGDRTRGVVGWRAAIIGTKTDAARAILVAERELGLDAYAEESE